MVSGNPACFSETVWDLEYYFINSFSCFFPYVYFSFPWKQLLTGFAGTINVQFILPRPFGHGGTWLSARSVKPCGLLISLVGYLLNLWISCYLLKFFFPFLINFNSVCLIFIWLIIIIICPKWRDLLKVSTEFGPVSMCAGQLKGVRCGWYRFGRGSVRVFWSCPLFDPLSKPGLNFTFGIKETIVT